MSNSVSDFGWRAARKEYTYKSILCDSIIPAIISVSILCTVLYFKIDTYNALSSLLKLSISILPTMLSLLLAGYAILISVYCSGFSEKIKELDKKEGNQRGKRLMIGINSSFAIAILVMIMGVFSCFISSFICSLEIEAPVYLNCAMINSSVLLVILFLSSFSIWVIKDITINIYNIGIACFKV